MTWGEFKTQVEACGLLDTDALTLIDCSDIVAGLTVERIRTDDRDGWDVIIT